MRWQSSSASIAIAFMIFLWSKAWSDSPDLPPLAGSAFSSKIPYNWTCEEKEPRGIDNAAIKQRYMDIYSWQIFVAVNWPVVSDPDHNPPWKPKATFPLLDTVTDPRENSAPDGEIPRWITWKKSSEIFPKAGPQPKMVTSLSDFSESDSDVPGTMYPLFDQNGKKVYYEIFVNNVEADKIKRMFSPGKRIQSQVQFQPGQCKPKDDYDIEGVIELKLAWKVLHAQKDIRSRFLKRTVHIKKEGTDEEVPVEMGLVGMHIAHKTRDHMKWIWSTFEHIDNVRANDLPDGGKSKPLFSDPACKDCPPPNCPPPPGSVQKTQLTRDEDIAENTARLNAEARALLSQKKSVLQYYELIGTQYLPKNLDSEEKIAPKYLRNTVIEPYLSKTECVGVSQDKPYEPSSCIGCHKRAVMPIDRCVGHKHSAPLDCFSGHTLVTKDMVCADFSFLLDDPPCK